jgi:hypothetical protein
MLVSRSRETIEVIERAKRYDIIIAFNLISVRAVRR